MAERFMTSQREVIDAGAIGASGEYVKRAVDAIEAVLSDSKARGVSVQERSNLRSALLQEARQELREHLQADVAAAQGKLDALRQRTDRDRSRRAGELDLVAQRAARRYGAMTSDELSQEAQAVLSGQATPDPVVLDTLSIALKNADPAAHAMLRKHIKDKRLDDVTLQTPEGKALDRELAAFEAAQRDGYCVVRIDNSISPYSWTAAVEEVSLEHEVMQRASAPTPAAPAPSLGDLLPKGGRRGA